MVASRGGVFALLRLFLLHLLLLKVIASCQGPRTQAALFSNLTADYDSRERPAAEGDPVDVQIEIFMTSLTMINQKQQELGVAGYFRLWWTDPRLAFKSKSQGGCLDKILLTEEEKRQVWQPDIYFDNSLREEYGADLMQVSPSGEVWKSDRMNHLFDCKMDFRRLPYDTQMCTVIIGSYSQDAGEVRVFPKPGNTSLVVSNDHLQTSEWAFDDVRSYTVVTTHHDIDFYYVHFDITIKRRPDFYMRGIVLKAVLFVVISYCSFFINRTVAPARVAVGVIPVLIMMNLMASVDTFLPPIAYTTFLTAFLMSCLCFTSLSVFQYAVVCYCLQLEVWYSEKCGVLMQLSHSKLKRSNQTVEETTIKVPDGQRHIQRNRNRLWESGEHATGDTAASSSDIPSHFFSDHPVITEIFDEFDRYHKGGFSAHQMRKTLRRFGQYRSAREVREIFERLGVCEGEDMTLAQFEAFLADPKTYMPVSATSRSFWDLPLSLQLDIVMRFSYLLVFVFVSSILAIAYTS